MQRDVHCLPASWSARLAQKGHGTSERRWADCVRQVLAALFVLVPFCYLSGSFTINPVAEAASQARHLQLLSGCPPLIYWAGFYVSPVPCT